MDRTIAAVAGTPPRISERKSPTLEKRTRRNSEQTRWAGAKKYIFSYVYKVGVIGYRYID